MRISGLILGAVLLFSVLLFSGGCTYEFDLVQPAALATHIGGAKETLVSVEPLQYRLQSAEGRLVMIIANPTTEPITLLGDQSYVVAPDNSSHPLAVQTIAPGTYIKLILPPFRPQLQQEGPVFGIGIGAVVTRFPERRFERDHRNWSMASDPLIGCVPTSGPAYFDVYAPSDALYWGWDGETDVRLTLVFRRTDAQFKHEFTFHRKKM